MTVYKITMPTKFKAVIFKRWIMRSVAVPKAALKAQAHLTHPPVIVMLLDGEKETWDTTLAPQDAAHWALVIPVALLKARGLEVGSEVQLEIEYDPERAPPEMPADIEAALRARPGVYARFRSITVPWQRQMIRYVDKGKSPDTREKYIEILIERVNEHALKGVDKKVVKKPVRKAATKR
jgi:Bacteriocin-protection, YdeI or OmpD-Associated